MRLSLALILCSVIGAAEADPFAGAQRLRMVTNHGDVVLEVWPAVAPETVANFVGLAMGTKEAGDAGGKPFYDGLTFHRVINGFMIQGGCPLGTGSGGPGYSFDDEISAKALGLDQETVLVGEGMNQRCAYQQRDFINKVVLPRMAGKGDAPGLPQEERDRIYREVLGELKDFSLMDFYRDLGYRYDDSLPSQHPVKGSLCMANSGPNTNGSQFFINLGDTPHLAGKHTVFGKVVEGMEVVETIGKLPVGAGSKPQKPVVIESIRLIDETAAVVDGTTEGDAAGSPAATATDQPADP